MKHSNGIFSFSKKSIDRYEDLIHQFLQNFKYNIAEKVYFKDLCQIKQLPNQSIHDFVKVWICIANKITMPKQDLKYTFANALLHAYKLLVSSNRDMTLGDMMDVVFKKEPCIKKLYTICNNSTPTYQKMVQKPENNK